MKFKGSTSLFNVLARFSAIFSLLEHIAMAAEAPDGHSGGLGRVEEVRDGLTVGHPGGHREEKLNSNCLACLYIARRCLQHFNFSLYVSYSYFFGPLEYLMQSVLA